MPAETPPAEAIAQFRELWNSGKGLNKTEIAQKTGWDRGTVAKYIINNPKEPHHKAGNTWAEDGETASWSGITNRPIKTLKELCEVAQVDPAIWFVKTFECTDWTVGMKVGHKENEQVVQTQQYRVSAKFERIQKRYLHEAQEMIDKRRQKFIPKYPKAFSRKSKGNYLAIMGLSDVHLGKLCWAKETGNNYDLKIAEAVFENAAEDLINEVRGREISHWLLPIGNDFFHIDSYRNQTTAGTPMDSDGRYPKIFYTGAEAMFRVIRRMLTVAPVDAFLIAGNHDKHAAFHLCREVMLEFKHVDAVSVDTSPISRKYHRYGVTMLGFSHGDKVKPEKLPSLMVSEKRNELAGTKCTDWYIGDKHRRQAWTTMPVQTFEGSTVRVIKSLTGTDAWHFEHGFIDDQQAAEVYFYERHSGYAGHAVARARKR